MPPLWVLESLSAWTAFPFFSFKPGIYLTGPALWATSY